MTGLDRMGPVLLVLLLLLGTLWFLKRKGLATFSGMQFGSSRSRLKEMESLERLTLTAQHSLHLVRVRNRVLVIGVAPSGCTLIQECGPTSPAPGDQK